MNVRAQNLLTKLFMELGTHSWLRFKGGKTDKQVFVYATSCLKMPLDSWLLLLPN